MAIMPEFFKIKFMNTLQNFSQKENTMTSKEIAELTGKTHSNIMVDIRKIVQQLENQHELKFQLMSEAIKIGNGATRKSEYYSLTKKETLLLISGYNVNLRMAIINRWEELEIQNQFRLPQTFSEALILAGNLAKENETLQIEQKINAPKAKSYDTFMSKDTLQNATTVGQLFGISAVKLNKVLNEHNVYNKSIKRSKVFNLWFVEKGFGKTIENEAGFSQSLFTPKGVDFVSELFEN